MSEYKSRFTGNEVDESVERSKQALTQNDIAQGTGDSPDKVMSQGAVTNALKNVASAEVINEKIAQHNNSNDAHPYLQNRIATLESQMAQKPNVLNSRSESESDTYSAKYIGDNFAPLTFVTSSYASVTSDTTARLVNEKPTISASNVLLSENTTNTDYDWDSPTFTFTRILENKITLTQSNSLELNLFFLVSRNASVSWGARLKVSKNNGATWTYISTNQAYGANTYATGVGNSIDLIVQSDLLTTGTTYDVGDLLAIDVYKKQTSATPLTITVHCGVEVDGAEIYTYAQYNTENVFINTNQIVDNSITKQKLAQTLQDEIDNKQDAIDENNKIDSDFINTTGQENQFITTGEKRKLQSLIVNGDDYDLGTSQFYLKDYDGSTFASYTQLITDMQDGELNLIVFLPFDAGEQVLMSLNANNELCFSRGNKFYTLKDDGLEVWQKSTQISNTSTNNDLATAKAVYDYIESVVGISSQLLGNTEDL